MKPKRYHYHFNVLGRHYDILSPTENRARDFLVTLATVKQGTAAARAAKVVKLLRKPTLAR